MAGTGKSSQSYFSATQRVPEQFFLLLQRVEHVHRGGLLQAVGLEGRQHVDELQKDLTDVHRQ